MSANWVAAVSDLRIVHLIEPICVQISDGSMERSEHFNDMNFEGFFPQAKVIFMLFHSLNRVK